MFVKIKPKENEKILDIGIHLSKDNREKNIRKSIYYKNLYAIIDKGQKIGSTVIVEFKLDSSK